MATKEYMTKWRKANRLAVRAYGQEYRKTHEAEYKGYRTKAWLKKRAFMDNLKKGPCADCGVQYPPYVMDFDHVGEKSLKISESFQTSSTRLLNEIAKCELVCANCHRIRTHERY